MASPSPSTKNSGALARARAANRGGSLVRGGSSYRSLADADDRVALRGDDLTAAVGEFFGAEAAKLQQQVMAATPTQHGSSTTSGGSFFAEHGTAAVAPTAVITTEKSAPQSTEEEEKAKAAAQNQLLATLARQMKEAETFQQMRGLLKKRGGAQHSLPLRGTTWHWRFCVLHPHALAIHDGSDRPKALRSAVPLKHVLTVVPATEEEAGGRTFAFALHTSLGRSWIFCCSMRPHALLTLFACPPVYLTRLTCDGPPDSRTLSRARSVSDRPGQLAKGTARVPAADPRRRPLERAQWARADRGAVR